MKTVGISAVGGVGRAIADIVIKGYSSVDLYDLDVSRFLGLHNNRRFLMDRVREVPGKIFNDFLKLILKHFSPSRHALWTSISVS